MQHFLTLLALVGWLGLASSGLAQPRIGVDAGKTRIVFSLPQSATYAVVKGPNRLVLRFRGTPGRSGSGVVNSAQVSAWRVEPSSGGSTYTVGLKPGTQHRTFELSAPRRLVLDISGGGTSSAASRAQPTVRPRPSRPPAPIVVLDPGHGGVDPGAVGYVQEHAVTLDVALRVRSLLQARGIRVVMTRSANRHLSADKRTDLGMRAEMGNSRRNVFVSIHANAATSIAQGIEVYYFGDTLDARLLSKAILENGGGSVGQRLTREARAVAQSLLRDLLAQANLKFSEELARAVLRNMIRQTGAVNRGVQTAPFYVIRTPRIPSILIEVGFVNHPEEGRNLGTAAYRQKLATGIAEGIVGFLGDSVASR
ncbi:MAG: N-acetylmuramoyl-L-alanine amidase [Meiothermus sp.]|nr:N-acetylmuramoyl-L-alanine amidase [Meiothermus sp.]